VKRETANVKCIPNVEAHVYFAAIRQARAAANKSAMNLGAAKKLLNSKIASYFTFAVSREGLRMGQKKVAPCGSDLL
jgi:hypothetical protein